MYVGGWASSINFPQVDPIQAMDPGCCYQRASFVAKIKLSGDGVNYAVVLGGRGQDLGVSGIGVAADGSVFAAGRTSSFNPYPITPGFQVPVKYVDAEGFIVKLSTGKHATCSVVVQSGWRRTGGDLHGRRPEHSVSRHSHFLFGHDSSGYCSGRSGRCFDVGQSCAGHPQDHRRFQRRRRGISCVVPNGQWAMTLSKYLRCSFGLFLAAAGALAWAGKPGANTPPTVSLTTPANGASYTAPATITLAATAADSDGTIAKVEFFRGKKLIGASTAAPYGVTWSNVPAGSYSLTAKATDNGGAVATSPEVPITVTAPNNNVLISSPANGSTVYGGAATVSGTFVGGTSTVWVDNGSSSRLAALNGNSYSAIVPLHVGSNTLTVTVARTDKTSDKASVNVNGNLNPLLVFTAPSQTVHSAPANIALAVDAVSPSGTIGSVSFYRNGALLGSVAAPPYQYSWTNVPAGSYTISATGTDNNGQSGTTSLPITVMGANILPSVGLTAPANGAVYSAPASITLQASAADSDGTITSVEFLQNGTLLGGTNIVPYGLALTNVAAGSYAFAARATDNRGGVVTSLPGTSPLRRPTTRPLSTSPARRPTHPTLRLPAWRWPLPPPTATAL